MLSRTTRLRAIEEALEGEIFHNRAFRWHPLAKSLLPRDAGRIKALADEARTTTKIPSTWNPWQFVK